MKRNVYQNINNERILIESEQDLELKNFINKTNEVFGEDYALLVINSDFNIEKSINKFSSKFYNINSIHVQSLLLQSAIISKRNKFNSVFNKKLNIDECYLLFLRMKNDIFLRKELTREYIRDSNKTNLELFEKNNDIEKERIIHNINRIKQYENELIGQIEFNRKSSYKKTKKGNW